MSGYKMLVRERTFSLCSIPPPPPSFPTFIPVVSSHFVSHKPGAPSYPKADEDSSFRGVMEEGNSSVGKGPRTPSVPAGLHHSLSLSFSRSRGERERERVLVDTNRWNVVRKGTRGPGHTVNGDVPD